MNSAEGIELLLTANHKILTQDGYKEVRELTSNDYIFKPKNLSLMDRDVNVTQDLDFIFFIRILSW